MRTTEPTAKSASMPKNGLFASLRASLGADGTGATSPRATRLALLAGVVCATLALAATPASAAITHEFRGSITETEPGVPLGEPVGLALDSAGNLFVADRGTEEVDVFSPSDAFLPPPLSDASVTGGSPFTGPYVLSVTVDNLPGPNQGLVYVAESNLEFVDVFKPEGGGKYRLLQERKFGGYMGVAFDNSVGPNAGKLYVFAQNRVVLVTLNPDGTLPESEEEPGVMPLQAPPGGFGGSAESLAVGPTGKLYFANSTERAVDIYSNEDVLELGEITGAETPAGAEAFLPVSVGVDPSNGEVYVVDGANSLVDQFSEEGVYLGQIKRGFVNPRGVVINAVGDVYVSDEGAKAVDLFGPDALLPFPLVTTVAATEVHPSSAVLNGTVNPEGVPLTDCHFDYVDEAHYHPGASNPYAGGGTAPCVPAAGEIPADTEPHVVHADITGLEAGTTYHFRVQASNAKGTEFAPDEKLSTPPPPSIDSATATNVTSNSVDLNVKIDPGGLDTTYHLELGASTAYGTNVPGADLGAGSTDVAESRHITGLGANTTYHWRVVATNAAGTTTGVDHTFVYATSGGGLPDGRAYEMVTPPDKNGALVGDVFLGLPPDFAEDGSRLMLSSVQCFGGAGSCIINRALVGTSYEFARTSGGWQTTPLAPSDTQFETNAIWSVGADAGTALFSMPTQPHGEDDLYVRGPDGSFSDIGPTTPPEQGASGAVGAQSADSKAATADYSRFVYGLHQPVWPFDKSTRDTLYEYVGTGNSQPVLVGVSGGRGSTDLISTCGTDLGTGVSGAYPGALSDDGRTVFFTATGGCDGSGANAEAEVPANTLYARIDESATVKISERSATDCASVACLGSKASAAEFQGASGDGSKAFFTSTQQLTDNASEDGNRTDTAYSSGCSVTTGVNGCNLYESECVSAAQHCASPAEHDLVAVSAGDTSGQGPRVQGVMAVSADGSHVYFVAKGVLSATVDARGQTAVNGADNLYVYERDTSHPGGRTTFIATLPASDDEQPYAHEWSEGAQLANVSSDGRFLVFTSQGALTPDTGSSGVFQVFRYDASSGELVRVSIGNNGFNDNGNNPGSTICTGGCPDAAVIVRTGAFHSFAGPFRRDPTMSNDGSYVFFMSPVGLTPQALNDVQIGSENGTPFYAQNVYEWHDGQVYLVSDGRDAAIAPTATCGLRSAVCLLGSDGTGSNVFFTTDDQMAPRDTDTQVDFYDARICTAASPCVKQPPPALPPCLGEACHGTPAATPLVAGVPTVTFNGQGNVTPSSAKVPGKKTKKKAVKCARGRKRSHGRCVKAKRGSRHSKGRAKR